LSYHQFNQSGSANDKIAPAALLPFDGKIEPLFKMAVAIGTPADLDI